MKNTINHSTRGLMLFLIISSVNFASCAITPPPQLELRTLRPNKDFSEFHYSYEYCKKKIIGICIDKDLTTEVFKQSDKEMMKKLYDMGFILKVRDLP